MKTLNPALVLTGLLWTASSHALVITPENNPNLLAKALTGANLTLSNISYKGAAGAAGLFSKGVVSGLDIDSGIVLSSGQAQNALGPNVSGSKGTNNNQTGSADLTALAGAATYDANRLGFDFKFLSPKGGDLSLNIVFGSDEYLEWVNRGFNDVFALYVDGANKAYVPGTHSIISVDNLHSGKNSGFFVNNTGGAFNTEMDGFSKALHIEVFGLDANTHRLELAIADAGDATLDSWAFIHADAYNHPIKPVSEPKNVWLLMLGALSLLAARKRINP